MKPIVVSAFALWAIAPLVLAQIPGVPSQPGPVIQQNARDAFRREDQLESLLRLQRESFLIAKSTYDHGDFALARRLFQTIAEGESPPSQYFMGVMCAKGEGGPRDDVQAAGWFRKAADKGVAEAQFNLAMAYLAGQGVTADNEQGAKWLRRAADQGLARAQFNLGVLYENGQGVPPDADRAAAWYRKAAAGGVK